MPPDHPPASAESALSVRSAACEPVRRGRLGAWHSSHDGRHRSALCVGSTLKPTFAPLVDRGCLGERVGLTDRAMANSFASPWRMPQARPLGPGAAFATRRHEGNLWPVNQGDSVSTIVLAGELGAQWAGCGQAQTDAGCARRSRVERRIGEKHVVRQVGRVSSMLLCADPCPQPRAALLIPRLALDVPPA